MVNYLYHNALRATPNVTVSLFLEEPVVKSQEAGSVTGLILRHLVDGVMDGIVVELLCLGSNGELALASTSLSLNAFLEIGLGIPSGIRRNLIGRIGHQRYLMRFHFQHQINELR